VLQRNILEDWSVKDQTSCKENLHLGREDDIVKIVQVEGAKCINTWGPTGAKGWPNRAGMGLGRSAQAGWPGPLRGSVRPPRFLHPKDLQPFVPRGAAICKTEIHSHWEAIYKLERERREILGRRIAQLEGTTRKWRRKKILSEASPWSTVPCLAPWWGNLLICPWVVMIFRCNRYFVRISIYHLVLKKLWCLRLATLP
jgi:hypothetical protein